MIDHIIAVDFDGTLCENAWPGIGEARGGVIDYVLGQQMTGAKLILWTNRKGERLEEAVSQDSIEYSMPSRPMVSL